MDIQIRGKNLDTTAAIEAKIRDQLGKLDKYSLLKGKDVIAKVVIKVYRKENKQTISVVIPVDSVVLKAEASDENLYNAIDEIVEKLEGQIRKHKTKRDRKGQVPIVDVAGMVEDSYQQSKMKVDDLTVVAKVVDLKPMTLEEAIEQMEMFDYMSYMFKDENNNICLVYKKKNGHYGLLEAK